MENEYLVEEDLKKISQHLIQFFKQRHRRFNNLSLELKKNTLQVNTKSESETTVIIGIVSQIRASARLSLGVTKIAIVQNDLQVFFVGLELESSEIAIPRDNTMATSVLEKPTQEPAISTDKQLDADSLQSLIEICNTSGVKVEAIEDYMLSTEGNGRKINVFLLKGEKVVPTRQIQPLLQGFFNWLSASQLEKAMTALGEANILDNANGTKPANGKATSTKKEAATQQKSSRSKAAANQTQEKQARSPYRIPADFKPKTSYQKTLDAILESQGKKANELLGKLNSEDATAINFLSRLSKKYNKPEAAMKSLLSLAKDRFHELEKETSSFAE